MKKIIFILCTMFPLLVGCGNRNSNAKTKPGETLENVKSTYAEIVSFIVQGYQSHWKEMDFYKFGRISMVYFGCTPDCGYAELDVNGDGIKELVIGKSEDNGTYKLFDIWTTNPKDGSLTHLASGDDRDWFVINGDGVIIESTVDIHLSAPIQKGWQIEGAERVKMKGDAWHDSLMKVRFEKFSDQVGRPQLAGGYTQMRKPSDEEVAMLKKATDDDGMLIYTPLYVSTQVVAGTNYRFWCICDDLSAELKDFKLPTRSYMYCWVTVFKPLPGQGEAAVTGIDTPLFD